MKLPIEKIVSGGQSGVDRAALDVAMELRIPCGGWCPKGRYAEDGPIPDRYPLVETESEDPNERTELNVAKSDGTLILSIGEPQDGTVLTARYAEQLNKPILKLSLDRGNYRADFIRWIVTHNIRVLNVAGPRESHSPGQVYSLSIEMLRKLLKNTFS